MYSKEEVEEVLIQFFNNGHGDHCPCAICHMPPTERCWYYWDIAESCKKLDFNLGGKAEKYWDILGYYTYFTYIKK